jgi:CheY-like chemotaxis protein
MAMPRILVVDDTDGIRRGLSLLLRSYGFEAIPVGGGAEALDLLEFNRPDMVLLDLSMPETDGLMVLEQVKEWPHLTGMPVVVYSAVTDEVTKRQAMKLGATEVLEKGSMAWDTLAGVIQRHMNAAKKGLPPGAGSPPARPTAATPVTPYM